MRRMIGFLLGVLESSTDRRRRPTISPRKSIRRGNRAIRLGQAKKPSGSSHKGDTVAPNRGVIAAALLLGTALVVALPGAGLEAAGAGSEAEPRATVPSRDAAP
jgi:hypothetical protein